jgi:DNA repair exonuclease SbcCD nuclease subunit
MIELNLSREEKIAFISDIHWDSNTPNSRIDNILETLKYKLEDILKKCIEKNIKAVFMEGDVFNRVSVTHECVNSLISVLMEFKKNEIKMFSILGNHDIMRNSIDYIDKTPIQTLFVMGLVTHINKGSCVKVCENLMIYPVDYCEYPDKIDSSSTYNILLCHMFINANEYMSDEKHNLRTEDIIELGYDMIIAGHDHEEYPLIEVGKSLVVRHGSLLRGTSHSYNFNRKPNLFVLNNVYDVSKSTIEKVILEHRPYKEVASNYVLNKKQVGTITGLKDLLSNLADRLSVSSDTDGDRILEIIKTDPNLPNESRLKLLNYITEMS